MFLYNGREKWWLLAATIVAVLMAVGNHFMLFTELCFKYLPLYNKFRTVSMALVVLQVSLPLLGFVTLDRIVRGEYDRKRFLKAFWWALGLAGGFCLVAWLLPSAFGTFESAADASMQDVLVEALVADRITLFRADALRSLAGILLCGLALYFAFLPGKEGKRWVAAGLICLVSAVNLFAVGKRYLNASHFTTPRDFGKPFAERPVDQAIKADQDPSYRVLDLTVNVFNSSVPSYHHKSVGGYSPAKLQRYQDLIEHYLSREINGLYKQLNEAGTLEDVEAWMASGTPVLNALNTRYVVLDGSYPPLVNEAAFGPAWLVDSVVVAGSPQEHIGLLGSVDLRTTAVLAAPLEGAALAPGAAEDYITLTSYAPNELHYRYSAAAPRLAVFSEIYYPDGWSLTLRPKAGEPSKELPIVRSNWTFRAALVPPGEHELVMTFLPQSYRTGAAVSRIASVGLLVLLALSLALVIFPRKQTRK